MSKHAAHHIRLFLFTLVTCLLLSVAPAYASSPDDILGIWDTEEKDAKIEIYTCESKYCGKIVWLKEPNYPAASGDGTPGTPMLDHNNPNPELRKTPLVGLPILLDFVFTGDSSWKSGRIYNPETGKTYKGKIVLAAPDRLNVRGFIGISLIGRTTTWTR